MPDSMTEREQALEQARAVRKWSISELSDAILEARAQEAELLETVEADTNMGCACRSLTRDYKTERAADLRAQKGKV